MDTILHVILMVVSATNIGIAALLLYVYVRNLRVIRSEYNIGLAIFAGMFLLSNFLVLHLGIFQWPAIASDVIVMHIIWISLIQLFGLLALLYITWK